MTGTHQDTTSTDSPVEQRARSTRRGPASFARVLAVLAVLGLALGACGGSDGDDPATDQAAEQSSSSSDTSDDAAAEPEAAPESTLDLTPVSDCIAAADIVVSPTTFSQSFMDEQGLAGVLDLGALGAEFGGGQLFFYRTQEGADQKYASLTEGGTDAAVRQDGTTIIEYRSAVQDEVADIVMGCAASA